MPDRRLLSTARSGAAPVGARRTAEPRPRRRRPLAGPAARFAAGAGAIALAGVLIAVPAGAQVDPVEDPTSTAVDTTMVATTAAPTTMAVTTAVPVQAPPTAVATTARPVVTAAPTSLASNAAIAQATTTTRPTTTSSTAATSTTAGLLVEGTGNEGAATEAPGTTTTEPAAEVSGDGLSSGTKLSLIVAALIAIAVVVSLLTFLYWRRTRPYVWEEWEEEEEGEDDADHPADAAAVPVATAVARDRATDGEPPSGRTEQPAEPVRAQPEQPPAPAAAPAPAPAPATSAPVVPSLIDPDLRARLNAVTEPPATQAVPIATARDASAPGVEAEGAPNDADGAARWGSSRVQAESTPEVDGAADPDAPFRPPST